MIFTTISGMGDLTVDEAVKKIIITIIRGVGLAGKEQPFRLYFDEGLDISVFVEPLREKGYLVEAIKDSEIFGQVRGVLVFTDPYPKK